MKNKKIVSSVLATTLLVSAAPFPIEASSHNNDRFKHLLSQGTTCLWDAADSKYPSTSSTNTKNAKSQYAVIPDENLLIALNDVVLGKGKVTTPILVSELKNNTNISINLSGRNISNLTGIEHLGGVTVLNLRKNNITDVTPLEGMVNLYSLDLENNQISDISPLEGLVKINTLQLYSNQISDISPLEGLVTLRGLTLGSNQISDIGPLEGLSNLGTLYISKNQISDISPLEELTNMVYLDLGSNQISDIGPLEGMRKLNTLDLDENQIVDIGALKGLATLTSLDISNNQIVDIGALEKLVNLTTLYADDNHISDIGALKDLVNLTSLDISNNQIVDIGALEKLVNLTTLYAEYNQISDISPVLELPSLSRLTLYHNYIYDAEQGRRAADIYGGVYNLRGNFLPKDEFDNQNYFTLPSTVTLEVGEEYTIPIQFKPYSSTQGIKDFIFPTDVRSPNGKVEVKKLTFTGLTIVPTQGGIEHLEVELIPGQTQIIEIRVASNEYADIPDENLLMALNDIALGKGRVNTPIKVSELMNYSGYYIDLSSQNITDLTGIEHMTGLTEIDLYDNNIQDLTPLSGMDELQYLNLSSNEIKDIEALAGLSNLDEGILQLARNQITDISPLAEFNGFYVLDLSENQIMDISPLEDLVFFGLGLGGNYITDISPIQNIIELGSIDGVLWSLDLGNNYISDVEQGRLVENALLYSKNLQGNFLPIDEFEGQNYFTLPSSVEVESGVPYKIPLQFTSLAEYPADVGHFLHLAKAHSPNGAVELKELTSEGLTIVSNKVGTESLIVELIPGITHTIEVNISAASTPTPSEYAVIPDENLLKALNTVLGKGNVTTPILISELNSYNNAVFLVNRNIKDLTGIEHLTGVIQLLLANNQIQDLTPLTELVNLQQLDLQNNQVSDITPLAGMTQLIELNLSNNGQITDIGPIAGMTSRLEYVFLNGNKISDASPLLENPRLTRLDMFDISNNFLYDAEQGRQLKSLFGSTTLSGNFLPKDEFDNQNYFTLPPSVEVEVGEEYTIPIQFSGSQSITGFVLPTDVRSPNGMVEVKELRFNGLTIVPTQAGIEQLEVELIPGQTQIITIQTKQPKPAILSLTSNIGPVDLGAVRLGEGNISASASLGEFIVDDATGLNEGWKLSVSANRLSSNSLTLPANSLYINPTGLTHDGANGQGKVTLASELLYIDDGSSHIIAEAAPNNGSGTHILNFEGDSLYLALNPKNMSDGRLVDSASGNTYTTTITFTLTKGI